MNKIIVIILTVILVLLIAFMFVMDITDDSVVTINGNKSTISDFEKYLKVAQYEQYDTSEGIVSPSEYINTYEYYKLYYPIAQKLGVALAEGDLEELESGEYVKLQNSYNLSKEDYTQVKTEIATVSKLANDMPTYYNASDKLLDDFTNQIATAYAIDKDNLFSTYTYRIYAATIPEEEANSGDVSGELSGEASGSKAPTEEERKAIAKAKAVEILARVLSGDVVSGEMIGDITLDSYSRIYSSANSWQVAQNGSEAVVSGYFVNYNARMKAQGQAYSLSPVDTIVDDHLLELESGDTSEIIETSDCYAFIKVDSKVAGISEDDNKIFKTEAIDNYVKSKLSLSENKVNLGKIDMAKLCPIIKERAEQVNEVSGDATIDDSVIDVTPVAESGEAVVSSVDVVPEDVSEVEVAE